MVLSGGKLLVDCKNVHGFMSGEVFKEKSKNINLKTR
jgi:hypothetical protein